MAPHVSIITCMPCSALSALDSIFSIVTGIIALVGVYAYLRTRCQWRKKRLALEDYLRDEWKEGKDGKKKGQHTSTHLIRHLGLTEEEILKISFESKAIRRVVTKDKEGLADQLLFEYGQD